MKLITNVFLLVLIMTTFSHCSSAQKLDKISPVKFGTAYYQNWVAGVAEGGSGINLFIPIEGNLNKDIKLDSVYFKRKVSKLELKTKNPLLYVGRFHLGSKMSKDIIMSNKPKGEYGNELPKSIVKTPFELKENECLITFKENGKTKYFKIENIKEKPTIHYPQVAPNKQ